MTRTEVDYIIEDEEDNSDDGKNIKYIGDDKEDYDNEGDDNEKDADEDDGR
jgi:hypothetical protein